ncbi:MAG: preprotein translocase subunit SecG [Holosporaceae bacterium]|jgi:preprotein translocase subunit SecG|nr:preprotein translocase subunit SecG [Holosporaceae bacterium]
MLSFLLAAHFLLAVVIIGLVLLQKHDSDGALGSSGGGAASAVFSVRGQANLLTRATAILMSIFILNCLIMAKIVKRSTVKESIIDRVAKESVPLTANVNKGEAAPAKGEAAPTKGASATVPNHPKPAKNQEKQKAKK